ncbi:DUF3558 domain-containing protein [Rhodococcus sp. D2-41]|nr:DUF3558 domain-containing protein [Rhodococcus sp. D2-41]MDG3010420.1 DUF3558 domain-containing protein [Rhodococcus sp. D2-41]
MLAAACATPHTGGVSAASSVPTASVQSTLAGGSGRSEVTFDPCRDLPAAVVSEAGYDPQSRDTQQKPFNSDDGETFLLCGFLSDLYSIVIDSGNRTVAEQKAQASGKELTQVSINGRQGLIIHDPGDTYACTLAFSTSYGEIMLARTLRDPAEKAGMDPCGGLQDTAKIIASALPKGV